MPIHVCFPRRSVFQQLLELAFHRLGCGQHDSVFGFTVMSKNEAIVNQKLSIWYYTIDQNLMVLFCPVIPSILTKSPTPLGEMQP